MKTPKIFFCFGLLTFLCSCQHVGTHVNSIKNSNNLNRTTPFVFPNQSDDIDSEKLRRECANGAREAGLIVQDSCSGDCYYAFAEGETGSSSQQISSAYNSYNKSTSIKSSSVTQRKMTLKIYHDASQKTLLYQVKLDSEGSRSNVLSVARQICEAGFKAFPEEVTDKYYKIH